MLRRSDQGILAVGLEKHPEMATAMDELVFSLQIAKLVIDLYRFLNKACVEVRKEFEKGAIS